MARSKVLNESSGHHNADYRQIIKVEDSTNDRALLAQNSGALVILRATGGAADIQLPAASGNEGVWYEFVINEALDGKITIEAKDGTDFFVGEASDVETATPSNVAFNGSSHDELEVASGAAIGHVHLVITSDGDNWVVWGQAHDVSDVAAAASSGNA